MSLSCSFRRVGCVFTTNYTNYDEFREYRGTSWFLGGPMVSGEKSIIHKELSYAVVGCAQRVHAALGPGFPEAVYQRALSTELANTKIPFQSEKEFEVFYDGAVCGTFKADFFVHEKIILELKAVEKLCDQHEAQALAYLKASGAKLAILINFGEVSLRCKRFVR